MSAEATPPERGEPIRGGRHLASVDAQDGLFDQVVEDAGLEKLLRVREQKREAKSDAAAAFKTADAKVKDKLGDFELAVGEVARCGPYRIEHKRLKSRSVSFETEPSSRFAISLID
jgi:hypothetical protein